MVENGFYVYEHWRPDTGECFYVGLAAYKRRVTELKHRNQHYRAIRAKLEAIGLEVDVRIIAEGLSRIGAASLEIDRIAYWRNCGNKLANISAGGENTTFGVKRSDEHRRKIGESKRGNTYRLGAKLTDETKAKISAAHRGRKLSPKHLAAMSAAVSGEKNPFFGKKHTPETGAKVAAANKLRVWTEDSKAKLVASLKARAPRKHDEATKIKMRASALRRREREREERAALLR